GWRSSGVPILVALRTPRRHDILVAVVSAALLDADLGHEGHPLELSQAYRAACTRFRTPVVGIEAECAVEDRLELATSNLSGLSMTVGGALQNPVLEKFLALALPIGDGQHNDEHLAATILASCEHPVLADAAGFDVYDHSGLGTARDLRFELRWRSVRVVVGYRHGLPPLGLSSLLG